jgi:hypothetical protein
VWEKEWVVTAAKPEGATTTHPASSSRHTLCSRGCSARAVHAVCDAAAVCAMPPQPLQLPPASRVIEREGGGEARVCDWWVI